MSDLPKPRLRRKRGHYWVCFCSHVVGIWAATPEEAYASWKTHYRIAVLCEGAA